jgi:hypothetical protein
VQLAIDLETVNGARCHAGGLALPAELVEAVRD